tara:strand:- start:13 stop:309 length:297 start_codon:yes stop_codon:yes gene_type:complete
MKRNPEAEEIQGTINALVDTGRAMATSPKNLVIIRAIIIKKRKAIVTVVSERARKKSLTKTNGITKQNSTGVETNLQFVLAEKQSMQRLPMLQPPMAQ